VAKGRAVTLLAGAADIAALPPPFLLPGEVEYQSIVGSVVDLLIQTHNQEPRTENQEPTDQRPSRQHPTRNTQQRSPAHPLTHSPVHPLSWADQICVALPSDQLPALRDAIRAVKFRWERGFASVLLEGPLVCGVGACGVCAVDLRRGTRMLCSDGPVFDLRDLG
jgi:dihydroorotate dehydrogenase electron transfer subunit